MAIYSKLSNVRKLTNSSLGSIIDVSNLNFSDLSTAVLEFLNNVSYNETTNAIEGLDTLDVKYLNVSNNLSVKLNGVTTFNIDSQGRAEGNSFLVEVAEAKRYRHTDFNNWPDVGIPGEIIYTGIQNQKPEFGEDFIGYLDGRGWVSLTEGGGTYYALTLLEQIGSPGIPDTPAPGSGIVWIGDPLLATTTTPTTQDLYFTDENGDIFSLTCCGGGGGGGSNASYVETTSFAANTAKTITHGLGTNSVVVDLIDEGTGDRIDGHIDNYTTNTIDITLTQNTPNVRVVIVSAGGPSTGGIGIGIYHTITSDLLIPENAMYIVWGDMTIDTGVAVTNNGRLVIVNGNLINNGTYTSGGTGTLEIVNTGLAYTLNQGDTTIGNHLYWTDVTNSWAPGDSTIAIDAEPANTYVTKEWVESSTLTSISNSKIKHFIRNDRTIDEDDMYLIWGDLEIDSGITLNNDGRLVLVNGNFINSGTYNQSITGSLEIVSTSLSYILSEGTTTWGQHMYWTNASDLWSPGDSTAAINLQAGNVYVTKEYVDNNTPTKAVVTFTPGVVGSANTITHNLGTADIIVQLWDATSGEVITADIDNATTTTVDITFGVNPTGNVKAVII